MSAERSPLRRSLVRPVLWAGVERVPGILVVMTALVLAVAAIMLARAWLGILAGLVAVGGWSLLRALAEHDPWFTQVVAAWLRNGSDRYLAVTPRHWGRGKGRRPGHG